MNNEVRFKKLATELSELLSKNTEHHIKRKGQFVNIDIQNEPHCLILHEGVLSSNRIKDDLLLAYITPPHIVGLHEIKRNEITYIRSYTDIKYSLIPVASAFSIINSHSLWDKVSMYYTFLFLKTIEHHSNTAGRPSLDIIIYFIEKLSNEPESVRRNISIADYITEKTNLSRSLVMKTLATLKKEGDIISDRGILIDYRTTKN
ncbi:helix-turn-helix domain-containing protein [Lelliottia wanjuensis]|uniref:helix-turn-helix domain-containing protein n=1 Tax=Lelliottia wanjuensis TaxID=3050585 RepID=UPI00254BFF01|nr:helix-turn-helix domain-containing protein [Lelliottia sp. V104_15]MDK9605793.1 helix-turn-helix domain-containing protein [Lelliottia sp. V104_15]